MPLCHRCGKANATESVFCQDCGARLEAIAVVEPAPAPPAEPTRDGSALVCGRCRTVNDAGMGFCRMCGAALALEPPAPADAAPPPEPLGGPGQPAAQAVPLEAPPLPAPAPVVIAEDAPSTQPTMPPPFSSPTSAPAPLASVPPPAPLLCASCGRATPPGNTFCQSCGQRLPSVGSGGARALSATPAPLREAPSLPPSVLPSLRGLGSLPPVGARLESRSPARLPSLAPSPPAPAVALAATLPSPAPHRPPEPEAAAPSHPPAEAEARPSSPGRLVLVRDGRDHGAHPLSEEAFDVGRAEGQLVIGTDPHLAPRHARFTASGGVVKVHPIDPLNGVYLRLREPHPLLPGDMLLVGRQVLRYEALGDDEREPPAVVQHGVRLLGSALKPAWGRLRQITAAGTTHDLWHLAGDEVSVGASGSDVVLSDDDEVLPHHVLLHRAAGQTRVEDTGSSVGGTFLRLRGERELRGGDLLRLGDQLLRFDGAS